jgi:hypothetical protein
MRQWPVAVWHLIAILFEVVEAAGRWPAALRGGVVCLLPKAGRQATTSTPLEARPVVLLPMLYRMWAHKRGHEMAAWLTANSMEGLDDPSRSAEDYGTLLAADLERALVEDEAMLAACVDQSKAYDNLRLDLLEYLLAGSGVPPEVWRPIVDMAKARSRSSRRLASGERPPVAWCRAARPPLGSRAWFLSGGGGPSAPAALVACSGAGSTTARRQAEERPKVSLCGSGRPAASRTWSRAMGPRSTAPSPASCAPMPASSGWLSKPPPCEPPAGTGSLWAAGRSSRKTGSPSGGAG